MKYNYLRLIYTIFVFIFVLTSIPALNAKLIDSDDGNVTTNIPVEIHTHLNNATYTVEIPAALQFNFTWDEVEPVVSDIFEITVADIKNLRDKWISVSIMGSSNKFVLVEDNGVRELPYTIKYEENELNSGDSFTCIHEPKTMEFQISVDPNNIKNESVFKGELQFLFHVLD